MPGPLDELWHPLDASGWPIANINPNTQMHRQYPVWAGPPPRRFDRPVSPYSNPFVTPEYGWQDRPENPALSDAPPEIPAPWARWSYRDRSRYVPGRDPEHLSLPYQGLDTVNDPDAFGLLLRSLEARRVPAQNLSEFRPLNDWERMILDAMERGYPVTQGLGYYRRQNVPEPLLQDLIRRQYRLGPTAVSDIEDYARQLRTFENPRTDEISDRREVR